MSQIVSLQCDMCASTKGVQTVVVTRKGGKSTEFDLCDACYAKLLEPVKGKTRPAQKVAGRPQVRFKVTELPPQP